LASLPQNFLGLPAALSSYASAAYAILPIPYDATASYRAGARDGPAAVIAASQHVELFDEELGGEFFRAGVATLEPLEPVAAGPEAMVQAVRRAARRVLRDGKFLIGLGGEHGGTVGLIGAVMGPYRELSVLQVDAHADLRDKYQGSRYSHACVMRRVLEGGARVVSVGLRSLCREEDRVLRAGGVGLAKGKRKGGEGKGRRVLRAGEVMAVTARECWESEDWIDRVLEALGPRVYVSIDIDGFDPAYAPGTGTPVPGGLDWYQVCGLLRLVAAEREIVGADVMEVSPIGGQTVTEFLAARLIYKMICYHQGGRGR
jgi:agmatinase